MGVHRGWEWMGEALGRATLTRLSLNCEMYFTAAQLIG